MGSSKSSLSAGLMIASLLGNAEEVSAIVGNKIFPVTAKAGVLLPFIFYRRTKTDINPVKAGHGAETVRIEFNCYAQTYKASVQLAEAVRDTLDHAQLEMDGVRLRSCTYEDSAEGYEDDAYVQSLIFNLKI